MRPARHQAEQEDRTEKMKLLLLPGESDPEANT